MLPRVLILTWGTSPPVRRGAEVLDCREGASAEALPFADGSFDWVESRHVLPFVSDPSRACAELRRVAPAGRTVCERSWTYFVRPRLDALWLVDFEARTLVFRRIRPEERRGIGPIRRSVAARWRTARFRSRWNSPAVRSLRTIHFRWRGSFPVIVLDAASRG